MTKSLDTSVALHRVAYRSALTLPILVRNQRASRDTYAEALDALEGTKRTKLAQMILRDALAQVNAAIAYNLDTMRMARDQGIGVG